MKPRSTPRLRQTFRTLLLSVALFAAGAPAADMPATPSQPARPLAPRALGCPTAALAEAWLDRLDGAILRKDAKAIGGLFAAEIVAKTSVHSGGTLTTLEFGREEMVRRLVQRTIDAVASLKDYRQQRVSLEAALAEGETIKSCRRLIVKSGTVEQGLMNGQAVRFEVLAEYALEQREGEWLAVKAHTTQR